VRGGLDRAAIGADVIWSRERVRRGGYGGAARARGSRVRCMPQRGASPSRAELQISAGSSSPASAIHAREQVVARVAVAPPGPRRPSRVHRLAKREATDFVPRRARGPLGLDDRVAVVVLARDSRVETRCGARLAMCRARRRARPLHPTRPSSSGSRLRASRSRTDGHPGTAAVFTAVTAVRSRPAMPDRGWDQRHTDGRRDAAPPSLDLRAQLLGHAPPRICRRRRRGRFGRLDGARHDRPLGSGTIPSAQAGGGRHRDEGSPNARAAASTLKRQDAPPPRRRPHAARAARRRERRAHAHRAEAPAPGSDGGRPWPLLGPPETRSPSDRCAAGARHSRDTRARRRARDHAARTAASRASRRPGSERAAQRVGVAERRGDHQPSHAAAQNDSHEETRRPAVQLRLPTL